MFTCACMYSAVCEFAWRGVLARARANGNVCRALPGLCLREIAHEDSCARACVYVCARLRPARSPQSSRESHKGGAFILATSGHRSTHTCAHTRAHYNGLARNGAINTTPMSVSLKRGKHGSIHLKNTNAFIKMQQHKNT